MKRWLRPTLTRRVVVALVLAFVCVWSVLLAFDYLSFKRAMRTNSGLHQLSGALADALDGVADPDHAQRFVDTTAVWLNRIRRDGRQLQGELLFELDDRAGQVLYRAAALGTRALAGGPAQVREELIDGRTYWVIRRDTARWTLRMAEPKVGDAAVLDRLNRELLMYLLLAFPVVLTVLWLGVRHGLRPLRLLAQRIDSRQSGDLSPLGQPLGQQLKYAELQSVVVAFDNLLAQLRHQVQRERAFVQDAAHELRTPMAVISTQAHVIVRAADEEARRQAQGHLEHAIARASHLTGQLLELAALDEAVPGTPATVDVAHQLGELLAQKVSQAQARGIELSLDAPESLPWRLDLPAFQSIVHNLLDNALRYVGAGCRVAVAAGDCDGVLTLSVADDGPGIPPDERELVFERFYRVDGTGVAGSGLGLAIVRQAARRLGGTVGIATGLDGRGCAFHVRVQRT